MISYVLLIKSVITYLTSINILKLWMDLPTKLTNNDVKIFFMKPKYMLHVERFITSSLTNTFIHASKNTSSTQCQGNICPVLYYGTWFALVESMTGRTPWSQIIIL